MGGVRVRFDNFPEFSEVLLQVYIVYFIEDFFFYSGHRMFHTFKCLYKMHKVHHEYDSLYTWATEYFHPFDYAVGNLVKISRNSYRLRWDLWCWAVVLIVSYSFSGSAGRSRSAIRVTRGISFLGAQPVFHP